MLLSSRLLLLRSYFWSVAVGMLLCIWKIYCSSHFSYLWNYAKKKNDVKKKYDSFMR